MHPQYQKVGCNFPLRPAGCATGGGQIKSTPTYVIGSLIFDVKHLKILKVELAILANAKVMRYNVMLAFILNEMRIHNLNLILLF